MRVFATRKIDELGRILLPLELRKESDVQTGDKFDVCLDNGVIVLRKTEPCCVFCKGIDNLTLVMDKYICNACKKRINEDQQ